MVFFEQQCFAYFLWNTGWFPLLGPLKLLKWKCHSLIHRLIQLVTTGWKHTIFSSRGHKPHDWKTPFYTIMSQPVSRFVSLLVFCAPFLYPLSILEEVRKEGREMKEMKEMGHLLMTLQHPSIQQLILRKKNVLKGLSNSSLFLSYSKYEVYRLLYVWYKFPTLCLYHTYMLNI